MDYKFDIPKMSREGEKVNNFVFFKVGDSQIKKEL